MVFRSELNLLLSDDMESLIDYKQELLK